MSFSPNQGPWIICDNLQGGIGQTVVRWLLLFCKTKSEGHRQNGLDRGQYSNYWDELYMAYRLRWILPQLIFCAVFGPVDPWVWLPSYNLPELVHKVSYFFLWWIWRRQDFNHQLAKFPSKMHPQPLIAWIRLQGPTTLQWPLSHLLISPVSDLDQSAWLASFIASH